MKGVTIGHNSLLRTTTIYYGSRKSNLDKKKEQEQQEGYSWCLGRAECLYMVFWARCPEPSMA